MGKLISSGFKRSIIQKFFFRRWVCSIIFLRKLVWNLNEIKEQAVRIFKAHIGPVPTLAADIFFHLNIYLLEFQFRFFDIRRFVGIGSWTALKNAVKDFNCNGIVFWKMLFGSL